MKRNPARRVRGMVLSAILLAAWAPSALAIVPEGGAREGGTGASLASQGDGSAPARSWGQSLATLARALTPSLLALLALGDPVEAAAASQAQTVTNPFANLTQGVNLSGTDTVSAVAAHGISYVLVQANTTGALPSLEELNTLLARSSLSGNSILATLPTAEHLPPLPPIAWLSSILPGVSVPLPVPPEDASLAAGSGASSLGAPAASGSGGAGGAQVPQYFPGGGATLATAGQSSGADVQAALATLDGAQMYQVYYLMVSTANQLLATAFLLPAGSPAAIALNYAGTQLISMADIAGSLGAQGQILAAQATLSSLLQPPQANQPPRGFASASGALPTVLPDGFLYGTWQIIPTLPNGGQLFYRFSLGLASRISVTTEHDGEEVVEIANLAGPVSTLVRYRLTPGPQALEAAQASGAIQVVLRVPGPGATPRTVVFTYFRRPLVPGDPSVIAEVLTDTEADQAFFRLPPETEA